jgi:hypothetical protein
MMKKLIAIVLGSVMIILGVAGLGQAQNRIQVAGTIQAVDCQASTLVLSAPGGTQTFPVAPNASVFINASPAGLCTLSQYVGSYATVSVTAVNNQMVAERVDVSLAAAPAPPQYYPYYLYPYYGPSFTVAIGTIFVPGVVVVSPGVIVVPRVVVVPGFPRPFLLFPRFPGRIVHFVGAPPFFPGVFQRFVVVEPGIVDP